MTYTPKTDSDIKLIRNHIAMLPSFKKTKLVFIIDWLGTEVDTYSITPLPIGIINGNNAGISKIDILGNEIKFIDFMINARLMFDTKVSANVQANNNVVFYENITEELLNSNLSKLKIGEPISFHITNTPSLIAFDQNNAMYTATYRLKYRKIKKEN